MAIFSVHAKDTAPDPQGDPRFLREGFSWRAFLLGPAWLLGQRLFIALAVWTIAFALLCIAATLGLSVGAAVAIFVLIQVLLGLEAETLLERKWARQGYRLVDIVVAGRQEAAEAKFYRQAEDMEPGTEEPAPPAPRPPSAAGHPIGSFPHPEARR